VHTEPVSQATGADLAVSVGGRCQQGVPQILVDVIAGRGLLPGARSDLGNGVPGFLEQALSTASKASRSGSSATALAMVFTGSPQPSRRGDWGRHWSRCTARIQETRKDRECRFSGRMFGGSHSLPSAARTAAIAPKKRQDEQTVCVAEDGSIRRGRRAGLRRSVPILPSNGLEKGVIPHAFVEVHCL
jgi:hypothetical protein